MLFSYLIAIGAMLGMLLLWLGVQLAWRRIFAEYAGSGEDVLAIRGSCQGCGCIGFCRKESETD